MDNRKKEKEYLSNYKNVIQYFKTDVSIIKVVGEAYRKL
jgi:hypothetical protein